MYFPLNNSESRVPSHLNKYILAAKSRKWSRKLIENNLIVLICINIKRHILKSILKVILLPNVLFST